MVSAKIKSIKQKIQVMLQKIIIMNNNKHNTKNINNCVESYKITVEM